MRRKREVWIGLVEVWCKKERDLLEGAKGAYVNVLAWVNSVMAYRKEVSAFLKHEGFLVKAIKDVEPYEKRRQEYIVKPRINKLAKQVQRSRIIHCDEFHTYGKLK